MINRTIRSRTAWCSLAVASMLLVGGCSALGGDNPSSGGTTAATSPEPSTSAAASQPATASPAPSDVTPAADPSATAAPGPVLASRKFTETGTYSATRVRMRFDVVELKRRGQLLDLTAHLTNEETDLSRDLRWQVSDEFGGSYRKDITTTDGVFSGAVLTDVAGKKRYLVAADSGNACVCTVGLSSTFVGSSQTVELSATYAAPPATTTKLDVSVASLGTFRDLPIT